MLKVVLAGVFAAGALGGCVAETDELTGELTTEARKGPQLNLSHVECLGDGTVQAHFVLLHHPDEPGSLTGTWNGGSFGPIDYYKHTGNVWHYEMIFPPGYIEILSAEVEGVSLHNASEYAGEYLCGGNTDECPIEVVEVAECLPIFPNVGEECAYLGLTPIGMDDSKSGNLNGLTADASMDAYAAIVRTGNYLCGEGEKWYSFYSDVKEGDLLESPNGQYIGQVTYCECPTAP